MSDDIQHLFTKKHNGYQKYGAVVIYPFKTDIWGRKKHFFTQKEVIEIAECQGKRRMLSDRVEVVDLIFNKSLQIYIATYGLQKQNGGETG